MTRIRLMTAADLPMAMRLTSQAGWNQVEADWRRFLAMQPDGCFVAELRSAPVGTAVACVFGEVAWIAMVLVEKAARGQGIGAALVEHALSFLDSRGVKSVRLDATPLGRPLYERLGFVSQYDVARYEGVPATVAGYSIGEKPSAVAAAGSDRFELIRILDFKVTATDRSKFLNRIFDEKPDAVRLVDRSGHVEGYMTSRAGSNARQLGPCIGSAAAASALVADAAARYAGRRVFLDVPVQNSPAVRLAENMELAVQRTFVRMCRGPRMWEDVSQLFASSGPELG